MSGKDRIASIEILPVELSHRIFDYLDTETILFSVRPVCRAFRAITNTYDRYTCDFQSVSKKNFYLFCRLVPLQNMISLTLGDVGQTAKQIDLFVSLVRLRQLTRIRSITLIDIDESQMNYLLKRINLSFLHSLSLKVRKYDDRRAKTTADLLSSTATQKSLRKFEFDLTPERMAKILGPDINSTIEILTVDRSLSTNELYRLCQSSPRMHTLILKYDFSSTYADKDALLPPRTYFRQLKALSIEGISKETEKIESFLLLTPSIVNLKLIGAAKTIDGQRWEQFIQGNLPNLNQFQFYFDQSVPATHDQKDLELIVSSFRTPFWIDYKKWFIICGFQSDSPMQIYLYSIPICKSSLRYQPEKTTISLSTSPAIQDTDSSIFDHVTSLLLVWNRSLADYLETKVCLITI